MLVARFFNPGQSVMAGLSGGADSVTLLHLLIRLSEEMDLRLTACHINHNLRGQESDSDSAFCDELCDRFEIPLIQVDLEVAALAKARKIGLEEAGRLARHTIMEQIAEDEDFDLIALGHHADDQVETILFRLFRGTGPDGLAGIPARRGRIVRPLLNFNRAQILDYLRANKLTYCEDSSNLDESFSRNHICQSILPSIEKRFPSAPEAVLRLGKIQAEESHYLDQLTENRFGRLVKFSPGGAAIINCRRFTGEPVMFKRRLIRKALERVSGLLQNIDYDTIERILELSTTSSGASSLSGGLRAKVERGEMFISLGAGVRLKKVALSGSLKTHLPEIASYIKMKEIAASEAHLARKRNGLTVYLNPSALEGNLVVRSASTGDSFRPLGMKGAKSLGDFFTDLKVPTPLRREIPLLCDRRGIVWVAGYQIADRVKLDANAIRKHHKNKQIGALEVKIIREKY